MKIGSLLIRFIALMAFFVAFDFIIRTLIFLYEGFSVHEAFVRYNFLKAILIGFGAFILTQVDFYLGKKRNGKSN